MATDRSACYTARDAYYACADATQRAGQVGERKVVVCLEERSVYEKQCPATWKRYWDEREKRGLPIRRILG